MPRARRESRRLIVASSMEKAQAKETNKEEQVGGCGSVGEGERLHVTVAHHYLAVAYPRK